MDKFVIHKSRLKGDVWVSGSKNAALPIMAATILTEEECVLRNVPNLMDIRTMARILERLGKSIKFQDGVMQIRQGKKLTGVAPYSLVRTMRASFCVLGPLLARLRKAKVALPGGCVIGVRPVDLHIKGLTAMGAQIMIREGYCVADGSKMRGSHVYLGGAFGSSVLGTDNLMMAATLVDGETRIEYSACEPEVETLGHFLKKMGANIYGEGSPLVRVIGVKKLHGCDFTIIPDRIEAGTFMATSIATCSPLVIKGAEPLHLTAVIEAARQMGAGVEVKKDNSISIKPSKAIKPVSIVTLPYPGFPTDLQAQFMVCLCFAKGIALVNEKIYPDRFMHVAELNRMGAAIQRSGPYAIIEGKNKLFGAEVMASDLRASAALVIAGMAAEGKTEVLRVYHIDRGYERIEERLRKLGARITREKQ